MTERIAPSRFHGIGWRVVRDDPSTHFATGSFSKGVELVEAIARIPEAVERTDVDLRPEGVTVRVGTHDGRLTEDDLGLATKISGAARELGIETDLTHLQAVQVAIDALVIPEVLPFWRAVLGYDAPGDLLDPRRGGPPFWFQQMDEPRPQRNRIHVDLYVPHDQAEARIAAALAAGGHIANDDNAPSWWTLADSEGNEVDVAPWPDMDDEPD